MLSKDEEDAHLFGLISLRPPQHRIPRVVRNTESDSDSNVGDKNIDRMKPFSNDAVYSYKVRANSNEHPVLQTNLLLQGKSPNDRIGKHISRFKKTPNQVLNLITSHIQSFNARQSYYSRRKNPDRLYQPETLSIKSMYKMFKKIIGLISLNETYWTLFTSPLTIKFCIYRYDTCTVCDRLLSKLNSSTDLEERQSIETETNLHMWKANKFYEINRQCKFKTRRDENLPRESESAGFNSDLTCRHIKSSLLFCMFRRRRATKEEKSSETVSPNRE